MVVLCLLLCFAISLSREAIPRYSSHQLQYFEPISNFELLFDGAYEATRANLFGHSQPYPDDIKIAFDAFGKHFVYDLTIDHDLFAPKMHIDVNEHTKLAHIQTTYRFYESELQMGSLTILPGGALHAVLFTNNDVYQIDPISEHEAYIHHERLAALNQHAKHGMIIFRHSDLVAENMPLCGAASKTGRVELSRVEPRKLLQITRWTNCFPNDAVTRRLSFGYAVDLGYYKLTGSDVTVTAASVASAVADLNLVYRAQFNVVVTVGAALIRTALSNEDWNDDLPSAGTCPDIYTKLDRFTAWTPPSQMGLWHIFTACYSSGLGGGVAGLASVGTVCGYSNRGWTGKFPNMWLILAHEVGHNLGAGHTFQNGQGTTGGIMDYGDGKLNGIYQFNTQYSKDEICNTIASSMACTTCVPNCWTTYAPVCGNNVIEEGETCDLGQTRNGMAGSCCSASCALVAGAECAGDLPCCTSSCK